MLKKVLIANRGEIALRIKRAAESLGITPVMLSSEADQGSLHASVDVEVLKLEGSSAAETYLNAPKIVELALECGCDAVHPGYGFLSENAEFARLVSEAGMKFIGPSADVISLMGDKIEAKKVAEEVGVPLAASIEIDSPAEALKRVEKEVGFPVLLKAKAGGGGRGMRLVQEPSKFLAECERAQAEAKKYFGNSVIFAESYIDSPRHVEVQVFGDGRGLAYQIGTRDCSAQRRHQKLVEEAPAPFLSDVTRETLHSSAVALAEKVKYEGAGTVEFLVQGESIFFLEMNTRIQVEHPVTEEVYGIDLVEWQFRVAQGEPLEDSAFNRPTSGHAIELRIYAEDPSQSFVPSLGTISSFTIPKDPSLREDGGITVGSVVTPYYDALLTKLIVSGESRDDALQNVRRVLKRCSIEGVKTTLPFHLWLTHESSFSEAPLEIAYIDSHFSSENLKNVALYSEINSQHHISSSSISSLEEHKETVSVADNRGTSHEVQIIHRKDGLFEGSVLDTSDKDKARISQSKEGAIAALQAEVL